MNSIVSKDKKVIIASQRPKEKEFWLNRLTGEPIIGHFPFDVKKAAKKQFVPAVKKFSVEGGLFQKLMDQAKNSDHKLHVLLMAGITLLFSGV